MLKFLRSLLSRRPYFPMLILAPSPAVRRWPYYGRVLDEPSFKNSVYEVNETNDWQPIGWQGTEMEAAQAAYQHRIEALDQAQSVVRDLQQDIAALVAGFPGCEKTKEERLTELHKEAREHLKKVPS